MKRTTITLPDDLAAFLEREARRQDTSVSDLTRQALTAHFRMGQPRNIPFAGIGRSGQHDIAERFEEYLAEDGFPGNEPK